MQYTRFEKARIVGARALQVAMGAPIILDLADRAVRDPVEVAELEFAEGLVPITVTRVQEPLAAQ